MLASVLSTWHKLESFGKKDPQLRKCHYRIDLWIIFLIDDWYGRVQPTVGDAFPGQIVLG